MANVSQELSELLLTEARRINNSSFIDLDPVQFPRRFTRLQDIEIVSLLTATIAWGNRTMICRDAERMLSLMDYDPYSYVMEEGYEDLPADLNIHRTFFGRHMAYYMRGLRGVYRRHESLDAFANGCGAGNCEAPAWHFVEALRQAFADANNGEACSRCLPGNLRQTALKRINMALRWLVRDDGIVDMGVWKSIPKRKLFIPLDVHVGNTARQLGMIDRKSNDRRSVELLTETARQIIPDDPALIDFALFGLGIESRHCVGESGKTDL